MRPSRKLKPIIVQASCEEKGSQICRSEVRILGNWTYECRVYSAHQGSPGGGHFLERGKPSVGSHYWPSRWHGMEEYGMGRPIQWKDRWRSFLQTLTLWQANSTPPIIALLVLVVDTVNARTQNQALAMLPPAA